MLFSLALNSGQSSYLSLPSAGLTVMWKALGIRPCALCMFSKCPTSEPQTRPGNVNVKGTPGEGSDRNEKGVIGR